MAIKIESGMTSARTHLTSLIPHLSYMDCFDSASLAMTSLSNSGSKFLFLAGLYGVPYHIADEQGAEGEQGNGEFGIVFLDDVLLSVG